MPDQPNGSPVVTYYLALSPHEMAFLKRLLYLNYEARVHSVVTAPLIDAKSKTTLIMTIFKAFRVVDGILVWTPNDLDGHAYREITDAELAVFDRIFADRDVFQNDELLKPLMPYADNVAVTLKSAKSSNDTGFSFVHAAVGKA